MLFVLFALIAMFITSLLYSSAGSSTTEAITYSKFLDLVEKDQVKSVVFDGDQINIKLVDGAKVGSDSQTASIQAQLYKESTGQDLTITYYTAYISDADLLPLLKEHDVEIDGEISDSTAVIIYNVLSPVQTHWHCSLMHCFLWIHWTVYCHWMCRLMYFLNLLCPVCHHWYHRPVFPVYKALLYKKGNYRLHRLYSSVPHRNVTDW